MPTAEVVTRYAGDTYHARVPRTSHKCTNTSGEDHAAKTLAAKFYGDTSHIVRVTPSPSWCLPSHKLETLPRATPEERALCSALEARGVTHLIHY